VRVILTFRAARLLHHNASGSFRPAHFRDVIQFETPWLAVVCATGTAAAITEDTQNTE
jgi:hypothetical protein